MNSAKVARALAAAAEALAAVASALAEEPSPPPSAMPDAPPCPWVPIMKCGLPEATARKAVRSGELKASRIGRDLYVSRSDVERFIEARRIDQGAKPANVEGDEVDQALARRRLRAVGGGR